ncbi:c-type cytochrome [Mucilaginibacter sp. SMC90]|uniref:c-type cytochrome n=1 Tax=Mucilaginibacter sp. SMC90 TaxID=2929803 RepID=UPI001FB21A55|nr:c-type cytochrome [Mucilaginibacter sp. SMC90]UOE46753.1 c-type cytochrome [Mucilaginibacter sp. SMC90]
MKNSRSFAKEQIFGKVIIKNHNSTFMKKVFVILCISASFAACGGNSSKNTGGSDSTNGVNQSAKAADANADTVVAKTGTESAGGSAGSSTGEKLMATLDCSTCHKVDTKVIGPAFEEVAKKYDASDANIEMLAKKIISGGSGNWGNIAMTPHPSLPESDAKEIVKYILSLKK